MIKKIFVLLFLFLSLFSLSSCEKEPTVEVKEYIYLNVDSVATASVYLSWTQSHSDIFQSYQVYYSKKTGFPLSSSSLYRTITDRATIRTTVDSLVSNQPLYFRVRLVKTDGTTFDTSEVPATPK